MIGSIGRPIASAAAMPVIAEKPLLTMTTSRSRSTSATSAPLNSTIERSRASPREPARELHALLDVADDAGDRLAALLSTILR